MDDTSQAGHFDEFDPQSGPDVDPMYYSEEFQPLETIEPGEAEESESAEPELGSLPVENEPLEYGASGGTGSPLSMPQPDEDGLLQDNEAWEMYTSILKAQPAEANSLDGTAAETGYTPEEVQPLADESSFTGNDTESTSPVLVDQLPAEWPAETSPVDDLSQPVDTQEVQTSETQPVEYLPKPVEPLEDQPAEESPVEYLPQPVQPLEEQPVDPNNSTINTAEPSSSTYPAVEVANETPRRKVALILSGGGARGAFQVGAEKYLREVKGYTWDIIAGVSVGALNGAMLAMHRYQRLMEIWDSITDSQVYSGGFNLLSVVKLLFGAKSFYSNVPLQRMMEREFEAGQVIDDLHVGAVSLISGEYVQFTKDFLELPSAILASSSIPVVWPPVDISPEHPAMVDGGVRNITPVGDVLEQEPDEIVIINCMPETPAALPGAVANVLSIGMRALDILQNEVFVGDMKEFLRINALVKEAQQQGAVLHHPGTGRELKYYPCTVIEPEAELGEVLDFSKKSVQQALKAGVRRAREVTGRPGVSPL